MTEKGWYNEKYDELIGQLISKSYVFKDEQYLEIISKDYKQNNESNTLVTLLQKS